MKKKIVAVNFEVIEDAEKDVKNLEFGPDFFFLNIHFYHYLSLLSWVRSTFSKFWYKIAVFWQNNYLRHTS